MIRELLARVKMFVGDGVEREEVFLDNGPENRREE